MSLEAPLVEQSVLPKKHLVVVINPAATNGGSRQDEIDGLVKLDCWSDWDIVDTLPQNDLTVNALTDKLRAVDQRADPETEVVVVSVGGDFTHDASLQGIKKAGLTRTKPILATADAGNKNDTPSNLETDYHSLLDIVQLGTPTQIYPLEVTVTVEGRPPLTFETIHSLGVLASERIADGVNRDGFPKGNLMAEARVVMRAIKWARHNTLILESNNAGLKNGKRWADFIVGAGRFIAGGTLRFRGSSLTDPNSLTFAHSGRSWPSALGGIAARLYGAGPGYRKMIGRDLSFTLRGLERIQLGGEVVQIQEDTARQRPVTVNVGRGQPITALSMQRPSGYRPKHRRSSQIEDQAEHKSRDP